MVKEFQYPSQIQSLPRIQTDLRELGREWELPPSEIRQLILLVEELFSRIVHFAFDTSKEQAVHLRFGREEEYLMVEIIDPGKPFNPMEVSGQNTLDPLAASEDGMGQALIRAMTEEVVYERREERNILVLKKMIRASSDGI
jgi:anti-sigma regulatory factor (Ser/Thr protein kinase)